MKQLTVYKLDTGNCRAYLKDENNRSYVLLDQGHLFEKAGMTRFELHNHTSCGEPDCPIAASWIIKEGLEGSVFATGLKYTFKSDRAKKVLRMMDGSEDGDTRYCEFVKLVASESGVSTDQLNKELEPFI